MSVRTELLKDTLLAVEPALCPERAVLLTRSWRETEGQPVVIRRAMGFARILREMSIYIRPGELIVGNQASTPRAAPVFPEYAVRWIREELDELPKRPIDRFALSEETRAALRPVCGYWEGRTYQDRVTAVTRHSLPAELAAAFDFRLSTLNQVITNLSRLSTGDGHIIANYQRAMQGGLRSVIEEARGY